MRVIICFYSKWHYRYFDLSNSTPYSTTFICYLYPVEETSYYISSWGIGSGCSYFTTSYITIGSIPIPFISKTSFACCYYGKGSGCYIFYISCPYWICSNHDSRFLCFDFKGIRDFRDTTIFCCFYLVGSYLKT